ncbi:MAG: NAD-dependent epimerase/dehydratase family protein [Candidatus Eremiobacteraeota bacterium]|nr:NAD-dependent epimerase/dehydratase family protein [Candidatus Eremiobacteraeota bacterium]
MRVFVIGATGYVGSAVVAALRNRGDAVVGSARTEAAATKLRDGGIEAALCDVTAPESLRAPARGCDAVVYAVQYNGADVAAMESAALDSIVNALAGSGNALLYTSGYWVYGNTGDRVAAEDSPLDPIALIAYRPGLERIVLDGVQRSVRAIVIRPGVVYGKGAGIPAMWARSAKEEGAARFVGDGRNRWAMIHRDDLAQLYVLALERAGPGAIYNAGDETSFTVREMAEAAAAGAGKNGAVTSWPLEEARGALGAFADALTVDSRITAQRARKELGWGPRSATILDDLKRGSYSLPES